MSQVYSSMKRASICTLIVGACFLLTSQLVMAKEKSSEPKRSAPVQHINNFVLLDSSGKTYSLNQYRDKKIVVVIFLGTECPLAKLYTVRLEKMAQSYKNQGVVLLGVMSNQHDSVGNIAEYVKKHKMTFAMLKDEKNRVADQFQAKRTPEAYVLDEKRNVRYQGRIDDQFGVGTIRNEPRTRDLKNAIEDLLANRPVAVSKTEAVGCIIGREVIAQPKENVTFSNQISRLFQKRCIGCHREGQAAPFELTEYEEAVGWAGMINEVVQQKRMPPWHADEKIGQFQNDCHLSKDEVQLIEDWVKAGAPEGNRANLPKPLQFASNWQLPKKPDVVFKIQKKPFKVSAEGEIRYQYFKVDPGFTEDKWISAAEIKPGNHLVVHHILAFTRPKSGKKKGLDETSGFLAAYVPGLIPQPYLPGMAKKIPANSELIFQVHYTPVGSAQEDISEIGLLFTEEKSVTHLVMTSSAMNNRFIIPAYANNYEVTANSPRAQTSVQLLALMPHMHLRGKSFKYEILSPNGKKKTVLSVPRYDFNWQTAYRLKEPILLPPGTRIHCTAHFDNSKENPFNPNPDVPIRWGNQTWEEMMIGYFDVAIPYTPNSENQVALGGRPEKLIARYDKNSDGEISQNEIPTRLNPIFLLIDKDKNKRVTLEELKTADKHYRKK